MNHDTKRRVKAAISTALLVGATALASNVTLPHVFTSGTPARAAEVNANFSAVKTSVDDNHARLQTAEGNVSTLQSNVSTLQSTVSTLNTSVTSLNSTTWRRGGNTGTNPATDYLGTADSAQLDLRVNASSVMRLGPGQVGINTTILPTAVEMAVRGGDYANLYLAQGDDTAGFMLSVGDALQNPNDPRYHKASLYLDAYDPGFAQVRRLVIDEAGRVALNRADAFAGSSAYPLIVGTDAQTGNGAHLTPGGVWTSTSSRALKQAFAQLNTAAVLEKVVALEVSSWEYKGSPEGRHVGPVAEDFHAAFGLAGEGKFISANDLAGVSLAAIQGLNAKLEKENAELTRRLADLERRLAALER
ncbi:MAG: tail fiber domain-containing protein [Myxococcota bacterium]